MADPQTGKIGRIVRNDVHQLEVVLTGRDEPVVDARIARCFPWTLPDGYLSVRDKDGKEVALLRTLDELDPASRKVVEEELHEKIFHPEIRRIVSHKNKSGVIAITADTDRGEVTFQLRSRDDIRVLSATHALFRDADGNTYELRDVRALDPASRKALQDYL